MAAPCDAALAEALQPADEPEGASVERLTPVAAGVAGRPDAANDAADSIEEERGAPAVSHEARSIIVGEDAEPLLRGTQAAAQEAGIVDEAPLLSSAAAQEAALHIDSPGSLDVDDARHPAAGFLPIGTHVEVRHGPGFVARAPGTGLREILRGTFVKGTWCRARVQAYDATSQTYSLLYDDGPYNESESAAATHVRLPAETLFFRVPRGAIGVDYENAYLSRGDVPRRFTTAFEVRFTPLLCVAQLAFFFACARGPITAFSPMSGPKWMEYALVGELVSNCGDLRWQLWRFISYSVVHEGWVHVCTNVFMELFFGFLLESAHGSKRTAVVFLTGVLGGAVACATLDTHSSVAGASGGVFGLVAAQIAVVLLHWQSLKRGVATRAFRLGAIAIVLLVEVLSSAPWTAKSISAEGLAGARVSSAAHVGGALGGLLAGLVVLQR